MRHRTAILAAFAGTLALAQVDVARADYGAASEPRVAETKMTDRVMLAGGVPDIVGSLRVDQAWKSEQIAGAKTKKATPKSFTTGRSQSYFDFNAGIRKEKSKENKR